MKQVYLLRHAHTEPHGLSTPDIERRLDARGQKAAKVIAAYVKNNEITFDYVMCSSALRAQETLESLRSVIGTDVIEISDDFYNIPEDEILYHLRHVDEMFGSVLYIGHNPGIAFSILKFAKATPVFITEGVTPGTLVGLQFSSDQWMDLEWGTGEVIGVFQPD